MSMLPIDRCAEELRQSLQEVVTGFVGSARRNGSHHVMFVSARSGEGTTTVATCTALQLTRHFAARVCLVEANLYAPAMSSFLDRPSLPGLLDHLDEGVAMTEEALGDVGENLRVLAAGGRRAARAGELANDSAKRLIQDCSAFAPHLIVDAPPILEYPESCTLMDLADEIVLVVRAGSTSEMDAKSALRILQEAGGHVSGVVMNRYKPDRILGIPVS